VEARLEPPCDVASAVKLLGSLRNKFPEATFAIRGGGHSPNVGAANVANGVTIDMRRMKSIVVNDEGAVAGVGAGAIWSDVYAELLTKTLSVVGGRVAGVGVGGFVTGGKDFFSYLVNLC